MPKEEQQDIEFTQDPDYDESTGQASAGVLSQAGVSASDWTTETRLRQLEQGNIFLNPAFQRRARGFGGRRVHSPRSVSRPG